MTVEDANEVIRNWETIKKQEKERSDHFEGIPAALPALLTAYKTQKRAAAFGFDADEDAALKKLESLWPPEDLGEALFWIVALARARGIDPESALRKATQDFRASF